MSPVTIAKNVPASISAIKQSVEGYVQTVCKEYLTGDHKSDFGGLGFRIDSNILTKASIRVYEALVWEYHWRTFPWGGKAVDCQR